MANYILLMTLTREGQEAVLANPDYVAQAGTDIQMPDVTNLGLYGVLGPYDFIGIIQAPDNDTAARYSIRLGVHAGAHVTTLPAVPLALLHDRSEDEAEPWLTGATSPRAEMPGVP